MTNMKRHIWRVLPVLTIVALAVSLSLFTHHPKKMAPQTGCVMRQFAVGSSGTCVKDIQTMVDYMETAGLNECPFEHGKPLAINGSYDTSTMQQVKSVQTWVNCYNKQEGSNKRVPTSGTVDSSTWPLFCTYAYHFPSQSNSNTSSYRKVTIAAGEDADCQ